MKSKIRPTQVYYWDVTFEDGYHLDQYSILGEKTIRNIADASEAVKFGNFFNKYEEDHGNAVKLELRPFTWIKILLCKLTNPLMGMIHDKKLKPIVVTIPSDCYVSFFKTNKLEYSLPVTKQKVKTILSGNVNSYTITLHDRSTRNIMNTIHVNFNPREA